MKLLLSVMAGILFSGTVAAQDSISTVATNENNIIIGVFGLSKQLLFNEYLQISPYQQSEFMRVLMDYDSEKNEISAERLMLLDLYNQEYDTRSENKSDMIAQQILNNDVEYARFHKRFYKRFSKLLGGTRAARFFQLENYLEQVVRMQLQQELPFIRSLEIKRKPLAHFQ